MKNTLTISIISLIFLTLVSQGFAMQPMSSSKIILLTPEQAQEYIKKTKDLYLLDVRTPAEYLEKKLDGSTLIPLQELDMRLSEIPKDKEILVYCRTGRRAQEAATLIAPDLPSTAKIHVLNGFAIYP